MKGNEETKFITVQDEILSNAIQNFDKRTSMDWRTLKNNVLDRGRTITSVNFDAKVIAFCLSHKNIEAAKSYIDFIYSNNEKPNIATLGRLLRLYYYCNDNKNITKSVEKDILNIYSDLTKTCPMFDSITGENVVHGLALTSKWKETLPILENLKFTCIPGASTYSAIARAAFLNNENDLAWQILNEALLNGRIPYPNVYLALLKKAATNKTTVMDKIEEFLHFLANNDLNPPKETTDELLKIMKPFGYSGTYTTIGQNGYCKSCHNNLQQVSVEQEDFEKLKSTFFNNVIIGKNVFNKTTPEELNKFKDFLSTSGSYDMVIDGLNVAYSAGNKLSPLVYAKMVSSVVQHFSALSMRILVLGRVHMYKWPRQHMDYIKSRANIFFAQNLSQDDPYILYATMASGLGTGFLSRDFMRGHSYLLMDHNIRRIFRRWQQLHQHSLIHVEANGKVHIKTPYKSLPAVQKHKTGWHIPYEMEFMVSRPSTLDPPKNWLCVQRNVKLN